MISVITAIHNGLEINKVFLSFLKKYTSNPFELIIIDNASRDGSAEFFEKNGAIVIRNEQNYSYPVSQNMGIKKASTPHLFFLNNDIIVSPDWDAQLLTTAAYKNLEVLTSTGLERLETPQATNAMRRKWSAVKAMLKLLPNTAWKYKMMHKLMYGNWEDFCKTRAAQFGTNTLEGFVGNTVYINRSAIAKIGMWDERIQAADFDLYVRTVKRKKEAGDIEVCQIALGTFIHHFIKLTVKSKPEPFYDASNLMRLEDKWGEENLKEYLAKNH